MKPLLWIALIAILFSCEQRLSDNISELLTRQAWTIAEVSDGKGDTKSRQTYRFEKDGTYSMEVGEMKVHGKWNWTKDGDICLETEGITIHGQRNDFEKTFISYLRIVELTERHLRILERHEDDSWESAFVRAGNYIAKGL